MLDGTTYRLLKVLLESNLAWAISLEDERAWPRPLTWSAISGLEPISKSADPHQELRLTPTAARRRDRAVSALKPLLAHEAELFDDTRRCQLLIAHAKQCGASLPSLYRWLRMYWCGGQCDDALLPDYHRCGRTSKGVTVGRGATPQHEKGIYQLTADDLKLFDQLLTRHYFSDERVTLAQTYQKLLERHYSFTDGNGKAYILDVGQHPSLRQFRYYTTSNYPLEFRLRKRRGDKEYELQHRPVLGTVMQDCQGVGHIYEADATISDVYLVATDDVQTIVGKPTSYLIVDRSSRLIVGVYGGLENPSLVCAKQALLSISQDKRELCNRYGVPYDPADWPAHEVYPQMVLVDLGEWNCREGERLGRNLETKLAFTPAKRADWKPIVESTFKEMRVTLQDGTPGVDTPENAKRRQGRHYERDASLTLHQFMKEKLELIIKHNRTPLRDYPLTTADIREGFVPTPINLWNRGIATRSGLLTRYPFEHVREQLLPRDTASVTEHGIEFKGCLYTCDEALALGWFGQARTGRFKVDVAYDPRLVDNILVYPVGATGKPMLCNLSMRTDLHRGRSFAEVELYLRAKATFMPDIEQARRQAMADWHAAVQPVNDAARARLASQPKKASRTARRADTKPARAAERKLERQVTASLKTATPETLIQAASAAEVVDLKLAKAKRAPPMSPAPSAQPPESPEKADHPVTMAQRARLARERLKESL
jgi:hypothetical protein